MSYQVTARKWRPMVFDDVIGQTHVTSTLRNAIAAGRVAHAYLFSGTRGCGKTTTARILARALNCQSPVNQNPDNTCPICLEIIEGRSLDVIEIDGASNRGVEEIRNLRDSVRYTPAHGSHKVYIIDEVHMLTKEAFNALLKTLEEPPAHVVFIFATTEVHKVPMTILSRCQRFDFRRIAVDEIVESLGNIARQEGVTIEPDALAIIARRADGSLRDSQSIFDQVRSFCGNDIHATDLLKAFNVVNQDLYFRVTGLFLQHDSKGALELVDEVIRSGYDLREFTGGLIEHLRNLLIVRSTGAATLVEGSEGERQRYATEAPQFAEADLLRLIRQANDLDQSLRWASQPRYRLEAGLLQMVKMDNAVQLHQLLRQLDELKKKLNDGRSASVPADPPSRPTASHAPAPPANNVRVAGEVNAGYLKSPAAVRYPSTSPPPSDAEIERLRRTMAPASESATILNFSRPASATPVFSPDDVLNRWKDFVGSVRTKKIALGTTLSESSLLDTRNGTLRLSCPDDFHLATLKRHKDYLAETFEQFFGARAMFEPVLQGTPLTSASPGNGHDASEPTHGIPGNGHGEAEHPLLTILRRDFGAERVDPS